MKDDLEILLLSVFFLFVTFDEIKLFFFSFKIYEIGPGEYFLYNFKKRSFILQSFFSNLKIIVVNYKRIFLVFFLI